MSFTTSELRLFTISETMEYYKSNDIFTPENMHMISNIIPLKKATKPKNMLLISEPYRLWSKSQRQILKRKATKAYYIGVARKKRRVSFASRRLAKYKSYNVSKFASLDNISY